jgi:hypothetical protein
MQNYSRKFFFFCREFLKNSGVSILVQPVQMAPAFFDRQIPYAATPVPDVRTGDRTVF